MSKIIGLCGNIGSGKSLAASLLKEMGAAVIDADALAREVVAPGQPAYLDICAAFGSEYLLEGGDIDRRKLGTLIFADAQARRKLNAITHPRIRERAERLIERYRDQGYALIVLEAALLLETQGFLALLDETWLIIATKQRIYERLAARDGLPLPEAEARLNAQLPAVEQAKLANRIIVNDGDIESLGQKLITLYNDTING